MNQDSQKKSKFIKNQKEFTKFQSHPSCKVNRFLIPFRLRNRSQEFKKGEINLIDFSCTKTTTNLNKNLRNFNESDIFALTKYNQNQPSLDNTVEVQQDDEITKIKERAEQKETNNLSFVNLKTNNIELEFLDPLNITEKSTVKSRSFIKNLEMVEEDELHETEATPTTNLTVPTSKITSENSL